MQRRPLAHRHGTPHAARRARLASAPLGPRGATRRAVNFCESVGADIVKLAIQFSVAHPGIATTLVGTANPDNIRRNIRWATEPIDPGLLARVQDILRPLHTHNFTRGRPENRDPIIA